MLTDRELEQLHALVEAATLSGVLHALERHATHQGDLAELRGDESTRCEYYDAARRLAALAEDLTI